MCVCVCMVTASPTAVSLTKTQPPPIRFPAISFLWRWWQQRDRQRRWMKKKRKILKIFTKHSRNADKSVCVCFLFVCGNEWRPPWKLNSKSTMAKENATENCHCIRRLWRLERMTVWLFYCTFHLYIYYDKATTGSVPLIVANHRGVPRKY